MATTSIPVTTQLSNIGTAVGDNPIGAAIIVGALILVLK